MLRPRRRDSNGVLRAWLCSSGGFEVTANGRPLDPADDKTSSKTITRRTTCRSIPIRSAPARIPTTAGTQRPAGRFRWVGLARTCECDMAGWNQLATPARPYGVPQFFPQEPGRQSHGLRRVFQADSVRSSARQIPEGPGGFPLGCAGCGCRLLWYPSRVGWWLRRPPVRVQDGTSPAFLTETYRGFGHIPTPQYARLGDVVPIHFLLWLHQHRNPSQIRWGHTGLLDTHHPQAH